MRRNQSCWPRRGKLNCSRLSSTRKSQLQYRMRIDYLANHIELAPVLAAWHHREWRDLLVDWPLEQAQAELVSHVHHCSIPTTFVAFEDEQLVGSASLIESDLDGWEHLSPWLASVYVVEQYRRRGVGTQLILRALEDALALRVPEVY